MGERTEKTANIDYRFKLLYAIGMILVVSNHCGGGGTQFLLYDWFPPYSYHIALFIFISGYFYKDVPNLKLGSYLWKKTKTLMIPMYLWNFFYAGLILLLSPLGFTIGTPITLEKLFWEPLTSGHQFWYNLGSWFVFPLFLTQCYNAVLRKLAQLLHLRISEWLWFLHGMAFGFCGVILASRGYHYDAWRILTRMAYFVPFYYLGILYRAKLEKRDTSSNLTYFSLLFLLNILIAYRYGSIPSFSPAWCHDFTMGPVMPFLSGFLGIAFWLRFAKVLEPALGRSKYVNLIADNTYCIMINHYLGFMLVKLGFALLHLFTPICKSFSMEQFLTAWDYQYLPNDMWQFNLIYAAAGIALPIVMQKGLDRILKKLRKAK